MAVSSELFRSLTPTGVKSITTADWDRQLSIPGDQREVFVSLTSKLLQVYEMMPTKSDHTTVAVQRLANHPILEESRLLFEQLPDGFRPLCCRPGDIILIAMRISAHLTLTNRGQPH